MINRRFLLGAATASVAMAAAGCSPGGGPEVTTPPSSSASSSTGGLPSFQAYDGVQPDLPGDAETGVPAGFLSYPSPVDTGRTPVGISAPISMMVAGTPSPLPREGDAWLKQVEAHLGTTLEIQSVPTSYADKFSVTVAAGDDSGLGDLPGQRQVVRRR